MKFKIVLLILSVTFSLSNANVVFSGSFRATKNCPAYRSIKKATNPDNLYLKKGEIYSVLGKNRLSATHYYIDIGGVKRWVEINCGEVFDLDRKKTKSISKKKNYLLALSWQSAFCETHRDKKECKTQTKSRYDATNFVLHGLWPQPKNNTYCEVSTKDKSIDRHKKWHLLPSLNLASNIKKELSVVMPSSISYLHRHEWIKHGSCYGKNANEYFKDSIWLTKKINSSALRELFVSNIGKKISLKEIKKSFESSFGRGSGKKITLKCKKNKIVEIWINLKGDIKNSTLKELLKNAKNAKKSRCSGGVIDEVGYE